MKRPKLLSKFWKRVKRTARRTWDWVKTTAKKIWEWIKKLFSKPKRSSNSGGESKKGKPYKGGSNKQAKPTGATLEQLADALSGEAGDSDLELDPKKDHLGKKQDSFMSDSVFKSRVRSIMTDNKFDRRVRARKRGKLDMTRLHKVRVKETNVFTQKLSRKNKLYHITLTIDVSGSMYGLAKELAGELAAFLTESMEQRGYNIDVRITVFSDQVKEIKSRTQNVSYFDRMVENIVLSGGGGTNTTGAMVDAYKEINRLDGGKIVICITDGAPNDPESLSRVIMGQKDIHTIGVGILGLNPGNYFKNSISVNDIQELKPQILEVLRKEIKRG